MQIREIQADQTWEIRLPILRPNGCLEDCVFNGDDDPDTKHFGAYFDGVLIGTVFSIAERILNSLGTDTSFARWQPCLKLEVLGQALACSRMLKPMPSSKALTIYGQIRGVSALAFYLKLGYLTKGEEFEIASIGPHSLIYKNKAQKAS